MRERLRHDGDRQDSHLLRELRDDGRGARARAAAQARRDEQHVGAFDDLLDAVAIFHRGLPADLGIRAGAEPLRDVAADLQARLDLGALQRLRVGVRADEIHAFDARADHVRDRVAAAAADPEHFDDSRLAVSVH